MLTTIKGLVEDTMCVSQGKILMPTEVMLCISGDIGVRSYLTVLSTKHWHAHRKASMKSY